MWWDPLGTGVVKNAGRNLISGPADAMWLVLGVLMVIWLEGEREFTCSKVFAQSMLQSDLSILLAKYWNTVSYFRSP